MSNLKLTDAEKQQPLSIALFEMFVDQLPKMFQPLVDRLIQSEQRLAAIESKLKALEAKTK